LNLISGPQKPRPVLRSKFFVKLEALLPRPSTSPCRDKFNEARTAAAGTSSSCTRTSSSATPRCRRAGSATAAGPPPAAPAGPPAPPAPAPPPPPPAREIHNASHLAIDDARRWRTDFQRSADLLIMTEPHYPFAWISYARGYYTTAVASSYLIAASRGPLERLGEARGPAAAPVDEPLRAATLGQSSKTDQRKSSETTTAAALSSTARTRLRMLLVRSERSIALMCEVLGVDTRAPDMSSPCS